MKKRNRIPVRPNAPKPEYQSASAPDLGHNGKLPDERIRDAGHAHTIFSQMERDDELAAWKRSNLDELVDGGLPFDPQVLLDAGQGDRCNVNFKEAKAEEDAAQAPYIEMTTQTDILWRITSDYGDDREKVRFGQIMSEEHTRAHRQWGQDFHFYRLRLTQQFNRHGVGFLYWENEHDWRWRTDGLAAFKLPRDTESRPSAIPYACCKRSLPVNELYDFIKNERRAREVGRWNIEAVKQAICDAGTTSPRPFNRGAWEEFVRMAKENDILVGSTYQKVRLVHLWVREFNDTISHYIFLQNGAAKAEGKMIGDGFLYRHRARFERLEQCIIPFYYGVGTHGTVHSIRGQGELAFGPITISNRMRCGAIDSLKASTSILLESDSANDVQTAAQLYFGPFLVVPAGKVSPQVMPDVSARFLPMLRDQQMLRQNLTGSFQARAITEQGTQERTKYEVEAQQQQGHSLDSAALTLFMEPYSGAGRESLRRILNPKLREDDPGGREAFEFRKRCLKRGVPAEALDFDFIRDVQAVRTMGNGSPQMRQYSAEKVWSFNGAMDDYGRKEAFRDVLSSIPGVGWENAARYAGSDVPRTTVDDEIAELENNDFRQGQKVQVLSNQNHWTHCQHHGQLVTESVQAFENQQLPAEQLVPTLSAALDNMLAHSGYLDRDATRTQEAAYVRKFLQQNNAILQQQGQKLFAEEQRLQEAAQQQGAQEQDPEQTRKWEAHQQDMEIRQQEFQMRAREFEQKLAMADYEAKHKHAERDLLDAVEIGRKTAQLTNGANGAS